VLIGLLSRTRLVVAGLAIIALVLGTLIYRDMFVPSKSAASSLNLYTVSRRNVTASITGTGNVEPQAQSNVNFKVAGTLTEIDVHVGDHVSAGQQLAAIDSASEQNALAQAEANLATAQSNLQSVETPLTQKQITQLQDNVATAQQSYNDTVAQVNLTNSQDSSQVTADQTQLANDQAVLSNSLTYQQDQQQLTTDKATLQAALATFDNDLTCKGVAFAAYSPQCLSEFTAVSTAQTAVTIDQGKVNVDAGQVNADQSKLTADTAKQQSDKTAGQRNINQAAASLKSAQDQLSTQTESKPNQIASAKAQVLNAQAAVDTAQQNLNNTTLVAPMDGQVTFDAVPNLTISGHVIAVASAATVSSGVVNYYATINLNQTDPSLKQGMTANATVTVSKATNALTVPNLAITHTAGQAFVLVYASGQQVQTPIDTGVVGDQFTEVTGGLNDGEQIVIPTVRVASGTGGGTTRFGGGGVRVGGGG